MSPNIKLLYNTTVFSKREALCRDADYQYAVEQWHARGGEDETVTLREHVWGQLAFAAGLRLGLGLGLELFSGEEE